MQQKLTKYNVIAAKVPPNEHFYKRVGMKTANRQFRKKLQLSNFKTNNIWP